MVGAHRHWLESYVTRTLVQGANDDIYLLSTRCPCLSLTCSQHTTPERHWDMALILPNLLQDCTDRVVRGISPEQESLVRIQEVQAEGLEQGGLRVIKGPLSLRGSG